MKNSTLGLLGTVSALLAGCALSSGTPEYDPSAASAVSTVESTVTSAGVRATLAGLTVSLDGNILPSSSASVNPRRWTLTGTTNKDLSDVFSFVPDDPFGEPRLTGKRSFAIDMDDSTMNTILAGAQLFVRFTPVGATKSVTASVHAGVHIINPKGSGAIYIANDLRPIFFAGQLLYRGHTDLSFTPKSVNVYTDDDTDPVVTKHGSAFDFDFTYQNLSWAADPPTDPVNFTAIDKSSRVFSKSTGLAFSPSSIVLTTGDAYDVFPPAMCTTTVQRCLDRLPFGSVDTSSCGGYDVVRRCKVSNVLTTFLSGDLGSEIPAVVQQAGTVMPAGKSASILSYRYDWSAYPPPSTKQILASYTAFVPLDRARIVGEVSHASFEADLAAFKLSAFPAALARLVYTDQYTVGKIVQATPAGASTKTVTYLVQVIQMASVYVVNLTTGI